MTLILSGDVDTLNTPDGKPVEGGGNKKKKGPAPKAQAKKLISKMAPVITVLKTNVGRLHGGMLFVRSQAPV